MKNHALQIIPSCSLMSLNHKCPTQKWSLIGAFPTLQLASPSFPCSLQIAHVALVAVEDEKEEEEEWSGGGDGGVRERANAD